MIASQDRSNYFGASDTKYIVGNWETKSFENWWLEKLGLRSNKFKNEAMVTGTYFEHKILDALEIKNLEKDKQIIKGRLRVNLDGNTNQKIYEIKTYNSEKGFKLYKSCIQQVQVQMWCSEIHKAEIDAYGLIKKDYKNFFRNIDKDRISKHEILYDEEFIEKEYLPKLMYLTECLEKGKYPNKKDYEKRREDVN